VLKYCQMELSERQKKILKAIVEEYVNSASPVGSQTLEKKANLGLSPATLRNEMAKLEKAGFLQKTHTSAGRMPTSLGLKFYIKELMKEKSLSIKDEVFLKERLWKDRFEFEKMLREATFALAEKAKTLAICALDSGEVFYSGMAKILDMPEFYDIDLTQAVLSLLDEWEAIYSIFEKGKGEGPLCILLGEEIGQKLLQPCSFVFTHFDAGRNRTGNLGVLGPSRLRYWEIIPLVRFMGELIGEVARSW